MSLYPAKDCKQSLNFVYSTNLQHSSLHTAAVQKAELGETNFQLHFQM